MPWFSITLRIHGETLDPCEVTDALKHSPTSSCCKGDRASGTSLSAHTGKWSLKFTPESLPLEDCCDAVEHILTLLPDDPAIWKAITLHHRADFFIGLCLDTKNRGIELSPELMSALAIRGVKIGFDVYSHEAESS